MIKSDDKRRARINCMRYFLANLDYPDKDEKVIGKTDQLIVGQPELVSGNDAA